MSDYCKLQNSGCFGILRGCIFRIDLAIRLKESVRFIFWSKSGYRTPKMAQIPCLKNAGRWLSPLNDHITWFTMSCLRYVYPSNNWKCPKNTSFWFFGGPNNDEIGWFSISLKPPDVYSWLTPQMTSRIHLLGAF